jgi:hypothetical protein
MALYLEMLLLHLSISLLKCCLPAYHSFIPEGDSRIAAAPAPVLPRAPSQYTSQGDSCVLSSA